MNRPLVVLFVVAALSRPVVADWTIDLPRLVGESVTLPEIASSKVAFRHGFLCAASQSRIIWVSPQGKVLLDATLTNRFVEILSAVVVGPRQCLIPHGSIGPSTEGLAFRLYTLDETNVPSFVDLGPFRTDAVAITRPMPALDSSGLYLLNKSAWTLTRIELQAPAGSAVVDLQSSRTPVGPWTAFESVATSTSATSEFFRLEIRSP